MRKHFWFILNGVVTLVTLALLFSRLSSVPGIAQEDAGLPGPAAGVYPATHLAFITYAKTGTTNTTAAIVSQPLDGNGRTDTTQPPQSLFNQPETSLCQTDAAYAAPDGRYLILQYNCEADLYIRLLDLTNPAVQPVIFSRGYFLDWSPDGGQMAYILMPDSAIPYTTGELWLADAAGKPTTFLAEGVDAGHGYPPAWSADGQTIAYIRRENPDSIAADQLPGALHSNIYQVGVAAGMDNTAQPAAANSGSQATPAPSGRSPVAAVTQLTHFNASLVYDIAWSPDGSQLAFTADDAVWTLTPGQAPVQVSQPSIVTRHPVWLVTP